MPIDAMLGYENFLVVNHPLINHKMALMRDHQASKKAFKELVHEVTLLLGYEAAKNLTVRDDIVQTPIAKAKVKVIASQPVIFPILRAGIGMVDGLLSLMPAAAVGHIGLCRNEETLMPEDYYFKIPKDSAQRDFFVCDPMLATGGSAIAAVNALKEQSVKNITFICILAAPEGVHALMAAHPDITVYAAALDEGLNEKSYIVPGLGDAGDRLFGT